MKKRIISVILALCLLLSVIPMVSAQGTSLSNISAVENTTENAPWQISYADYSQTYIVKGKKLGVRTFRDDSGMIHAMLKCVYPMKLTGNETVAQLNQKGIDLLLSDQTPTLFDVDYISYSMESPCDIVVDTSTLPVGTYLVVMAISEWNAPGTFWPNTVLTVGLHVVDKAVPLQSFEIYACDPDGSNRTKVDVLTPDIKYFNVKPVPANATNVDFPDSFGAHRLDERNREVGICWGQILKWDDSLPNGVFETEFSGCGTGNVVFQTRFSGKVQTDIPAIGSHIPGSEIISETAATCTEAGSRTFRCSSCNEVVTEEIAATGHTWGNGYIDSYSLEDYTITAIFTCEVCGEEKHETFTTAELGNPFQDVPEKAWYFNYVTMAYQFGLMNGVAEDRFDPNGTTTRAMVVQILFNLAGDPDFNESVGFSDVKSSAWYAKAVNWAATYGIVNGVGNNKFDPNAPVTREQVAAILMRFADLLEMDTSARASLSGYTDQKSVSSYAEDAMAWAVGTGIINGTSATLLSPRGLSNRAQIATMLVRFLNWADHA